VSKQRLQTPNFGLANIPQPFAPDIMWDITPNGKIIIGYSERYEFGVYDIQGQLLKKITHPIHQRNFSHKEILIIRQTLVIKDVHSKGSRKNQEHSLARNSSIALPFFPLFQDLLPAVVDVHQTCVHNFRILEKAALF